MDDAAGVRGGDAARDLLPLGDGPARRQRAAGQLRRQYLDRHVALEARVAGAVDLAHAAGAEHGHDLVGPETAPGANAIRR